MAPDCNTSRRAGVLLHVTALPSRLGMGDWGPATLEFLDFLAEAGQGIWQILPLAPTNPGAGNSPYSGYSAFALNPLCVSPEVLAQDGLLAARDIAAAPQGEEGAIDFIAQHAWRHRLLDAAFDAAWSSLSREKAFADFCQEQAFWLEDWSLFAALKREQGGTPWYAWEMGLRQRHPKAIHDARQRLGFWMQRERFVQYLAWKQWQTILDEAQKRDIIVFGDVPIYVSLDSCDVWAHPKFFQLDNYGRPLYCAGAPPDYFSPTGQMWGNPVYDWEYLESTGFAWWVARLTHEARRLHAIRLDHFRGFCAYWQVPACEPTAENGVWVPGPGKRLFDAVARSVPATRFVAEDLGVITEDVRQLMDELGLPGMRVLQFAFGGDAKNPYLPHHIPEQTVVYTGTHDNDTTRGWWEDEASPSVRAHVEDYLGRPLSAEEIAEVMIRMALMSRARWVVIPLQDYLGLGTEARFNVPGQGAGNWTWRATAGAWNPTMARRLRRMVTMYDRVVEGSRSSRTKTSALG